jgi:hypothetical protein
VGVIVLDELLGRSGKMRPAAARRRHGHLSADGADPADPGRRADRHFYDRWAKRSANPDFAERMGVLAATGLIVGESLFGVAFAGIVAWANRNSPVPPNDAPLAIMGEGFESVAMWVAPFLFFGLIAVAAICSGLIAGLSIYVPPRGDSKSRAGTDRDIANRSAVEKGSGIRMPAEAGEDLLSVHLLEERLDRHEGERHRAVRHAVGDEHLSPWRIAPQV